MRRGAADDDRWWNALVWKVVAPAAAVLMLVVGLPDLPRSLAAARDEGRSGTFTATREECHGRSGRLCSYYGTFVADAGDVELEDVLIDDGVESVGESVPAQYVEGSRFDKVYESHSRDWLALSSLLAAALAYLVGWSLLVVRPWLRRRRNQG